MWGSNSWANAIISSEVIMSFAKKKKRMKKEKVVCMLAKFDFKSK